MNHDAEQIKKWEQVTDPAEALWYLIANWEFIGSDPYYKDLDSALYAMANRACPVTQPNKDKTNG